MRLPKLPSHNNNRAEKSFQAFKLSDNMPRMGRRHRAPGSPAKKSFWVFITLRQWSPQVKTATKCYYCNQSAPAYTWQRTSKRTGEPLRTAKAQQCSQKLCILIGAVILSINNQVALKMHFYDNIRDASSSLWGSTSSFCCFLLATCVIWSIWIFLRLGYLLFLGLLFIILLNENHFQFFIADWKPSTKWSHTGWINHQSLTFQ